MKDKTPAERLKDAVALTLLELLDFIQPFLYVGVIYGLMKLLGVM